MMGVFALKFKEHNLNKALKSPPMKWMYMFLLLYIVITPIAAYPYAQDKALDSFVKLVIIMTVAFKIVDTSKKLDYVLYSYVFGCWYIGYFAWQTGRNSGGRLEGIGTVDASAANTLANAVAPSLVICVYYLWVSQKLYVKGLFVIAAAFIANSLVLINSRGSFLAVVAGCGFFMAYMYFSSFKKKGQKKTVVVMVLLGLMGGLYVVDKSFIERMATLTESQEDADTDKESGSTRFKFWAAAWDLAMDKPLGTGARGFEIYSDEYLPHDIHTGKSRARAVHSSWFEALSEVGYAGFIVFISMIASCFLTARKCKAQLRKEGRLDEFYKVVALESALISFMVAATFINRARAEVLYWLVLYIAIAYNIYVYKPQLLKEMSKPRRSFKSNPVSG